MAAILSSILGQCGPINDTITNCDTACLCDVMGWLFAENDCYYKVECVKPIDGLEYGITVEYHVKLETKNYAISTFYFSDGAPAKDANFLFL